MKDILVLPTRDVLPTPSDCDDIVARRSGIVLKAVDTITQILLLHTFL